MIDKQDKQEKLKQGQTWKKTTCEKQLVFQELTDEELDLVTGTGRWGRWVNWALCLLRGKHGW
ncbi:MAG: hypothetical protein AAGJ08_09160 [Cyanobacteria bacterium P01_H01_bin.35]